MARLSIPYEAFYLEVPLRPEDALFHMEQVLRSLRSRWCYCRNGNELSLRRVMHYRNPALPVVEIGALPAEGGSIIVVRMRLQKVFQIVWLFWMGTGVVLGSICTISMAAANTLTLEGFAICVGVPLSGYVATTAAFKYESYKAKNFVRNVFGEIS